MKVYIQIYKDITVALDLGSEYVKEEYKHKNIVVNSLAVCTICHGRVAHEFT